MAALSFTARFPYPGPQHDRQKLMRASLASSCLRGEMSVWQFMAGVRGAEVRRKPDWWREELLQSGVFHRVAREPSLCGEELVRPMTDSWILDRDRRDGTEYCVLGDALRRGHTEMAEWCMGDQFPAFQHGMFHERPPSTEREIHSDLFMFDIHVQNVSHYWLEAPLLTLMHSACEIGWDWGRRRIEQLVAESDDPVAVDMRESGEYAGVLAMMCARAGSSSSLLWAEAFAADAGEERMQQLLAAGTSTARHVARTCTLGVAEWLWRSHSGDVSKLVDHAADNGNWSVMEWLVRTGSVNAARCECFEAAAGRDSVAAMRFLRDHGLDSHYESAVRKATRTGSVCVLEWLDLQKPGYITGECVRAAAESGHVTVSKLRFLLRCKLDRNWSGKHAHWTAVFGRHGDRVLEWAYEHGLATPQTLESALVSDRPYPVLQFLLAHTPNLRCSVEEMARACRQDLRMVEALHARFPDVLAQDSDGSCLDNASAEGRADVVEFILRHVEAPVCTERALATVCSTNHLEQVQLLHGRFPDVALSSVVMQQACASGALQVVEWLHKEQGLAPNPVRAVRAGHLRVLEFFVQHCGISGPLDQSGLVDAVYANHVHVVEYLVRRGMVDNIDSLLQAAQKDHRKWPMQRFLRRHVAP